jgi:hypothetical protein
MRKHFTNLTMLANKPKTVSIIDVVCSSLHAQLSSCIPCNVLLQWLCTFQASPNTVSVLIPTHIKLVAFQQSTNMEVTIPNKSLSSTLPPTPAIFSLPRELRNLVYDVLFRDFIIQFTQQSLEVVLCYPPSNPSTTTTTLQVPCTSSTIPRTLPSWLLTNQQFLAEGLQQLYSNSVCSHCAHPSGIVKQNVVPKRHHHLAPPVPPAPSVPSLRLLSLCHIRTFSFECVHVSSYTQLGPPDTNQPATLYILDAHKLTPLTTWLQRNPHQTPSNEVNSNSIQKLKLTLILPDKYPFVYEEKDWNVDLSSLESFVPLHQVEIELIQRCRASTSKWMKPDQGIEGCLLAREAAMPLLKRELRGVAVALEKQGVV